MEKRVLGKNGPELTVLGFGAWAIGGPWQFGWGSVNDNESVDAIIASLDQGVNWIDTAAVYGFGHSEKIVAKAIKDRREDVFIATKCGLIRDDDGGAVNNIDPQSIKSELEASLKRLESDYVDLYQIHWPDPNREVEPAWEMMAKLKEEGKVKYIGVSNFDVPLLERCMKIDHVQSLQPPYNMIRPQVEEEILPYCEKNGIGVVAYSPMQSGLLTGNFHKKKLDDDDWRNKNPFYKEPYLSAALNLVEKLRPIAEASNKSVANLSVAWVLNNSAVTSAIVGARNTKQVNDNINSADYKLTADELNKISEYLEEFKSTVK
ncbi:MAG: aldo/keto reductase [Melioribacteraceae bacterium]|nr:aldo/keto reductase [Melioribacteraceae bacterium]MCF8357042.1 aldo/keto reductase [Melioribacteraceae bacterium]MCF8396483.1 aldo/keto reductase [Melioribacteraceae bacterium]